MKITAIENRRVRVNQRGDWLFVLVHTDAGLTGIGEASHSSNDALCALALEQFNQQLVGKDPRQIALIRQQLRKVDGGRVYNTALSALEQALWDLLGQHLETPVHTFFGGAVRDRLRLYANINRHVRDRSPAGFARAAQQAVDEGFTAIKLAPFDELRPSDHLRTGPKATWRPGVERVRAVRKAIGDEIELAVDCHGRMEISQAIAVGHELADCNLFWYEEGVRHTHTGDLKRLTESVPMPTASTESIYGILAYRPFLVERVVDVIMPDVKHCGGLLELSEIAAAARMHSILVAPHNPAGPLSTAATAQVVSAIENFYILEYAWGEVDWRASLLEPAERIEDGYLILSQEPGLGHRLNLEAIEAHR
jgi:galactonate dehydratase